MSLSRAHTRPLSLAISSFLKLSPGPTGKGFATSPVKKPERGSESLSTKEDDDSSWDHIFANIDEDVALSRKFFPPERNFSKRSTRFSAVPGIDPDVPTRHSRRSPMTAYEKNAFDSMFDMIFKAATQKKENFTTAAVQLPLESKERRSLGWSWLQYNLSRDTNVNELSSKHVEIRDELSSQSPDVLPFPLLPVDTYGKLRNLPKRTTQLDNLLDEKKEEISLCHSDLEVLEWAVRELFGESDLQDSSTSPKRAPLPPALYAPLLTYLMEYFISRPHQNYPTALALFNYAKTLSPTSYVFGCNTSAYNIYLQARWAVEQDTKEVFVILQEMHANGVSYDTGTRRILERIRGDVEERWRNSEASLDDSSSRDGNFLNPFLYLEKAEQLIQRGRKTRFSSDYDEKTRVGPRQEEDRLSLT